MKILALTHSLSRLGGGVPNVLWGLYSSMNCDVQIFGIEDEYASEDIPNEFKGKVSTYKPFPLFNPLKIVRGLMGDISSAIVAGQTVIHTHGLWLYPSYAAMKVAGAKAVPRVVSPHGMLDAWARHNSGWKKKIATAFYEKEHLQKASCIHVLNKEEFLSVRDCGIKAPVAIIGNGVHVQNKKDYLYPYPDEWKSKKVLLFLSRLHPKKGLEALLKAWVEKEAHFSDWRLAVVGDGDSAYKNKIMRYLDGKSESITYLPGHYGDKKEACFKYASAYVLPSLSEGLPISVLEAFSFKLPSLISKACNILEAYDKGAAHVWPLDLDLQGEALKAFLRTSDDNLSAMGRNGLELVTERYSWDKLATEMNKVYGWVLNGGSPPNSVVLD